MEKVHLKYIPTITTDPHAFDEGFVNRLPRDVSRIWKFEESKYSIQSWN